MRGPRHSSHVQALGDDGTVFKAFHIWSDSAPAVLKNPDLMFAKCLVLPGSQADLFNCRQLDPLDPSEQVFKVKQADAYNFNANLDCLKFPDIGMIPHTNSPCVLDFLKQRYMQNQIYSTAQPLLVAINPYKDLGNATPAVIKQYRDASDVSKLPPHVFSIARMAQENLHAVKKSQTIIVCGESGAGKTEATKQIMRYFAAAKGAVSDFRIQKAVMAANPVLEAFGNAKTLRNNNSSRFGRFMQLSTDKSGGIMNGMIKSFLLEKSRVVTQASDERSYHVFYQLVKGAHATMKAKLGIKELKSYKFLNPLCTNVETIDDVKDFEEVRESLEYMGFNEAERDMIFSIVTGVLTLGNVEFLGVEKAGIFDAAEISSSSRADLLHACKLLELDPKKVEENLVRKVQIAGGQTIHGVWSRKDAVVLCSSLAKGIYERLFFWIVGRLNETIRSPEPLDKYIGMLDIFGFEVFKDNSLEQLFINITNEMLQKDFVDVVFERETKLYQEEGISNVKLSWTSNQPLIEALTSTKKLSLMSILEDQCLAPRGTDQKFVFNAVDGLKSTGAVIPSKLGENVNFFIAHSIGDVMYTSTDFITKNKDVLRYELAQCVNESQNSVTKQLFEGADIPKGKLPKGQLIGSQFLTSLQQLMTLINSTEPHFIRCVKPNEEKKPLMYTNSKVLIQLHALSILEALQLRNLGYSYRRPFSEFLQEYNCVNLGIACDESLDPKIAAQNLIKSAGFGEDAYRIGKTMIFMKPQTIKSLTIYHRKRLASWQPVVTLVELLHYLKETKKVMEDIVPAVIRCQAHCRRALASEGGHDEAVVVG